MRILEAVADGRLGGGTTHVLQLIETLRDALPLEVHLASQRDSPALAEGQKLGATVHGLEFFSSRLDPRLWLRLGRLVRRLDPALIHAHGARAALPLAHAAGPARSIYSVHGYHFVGKSRLTRRLAILAERRCAGRADLTVFVCRHDRELAERAGVLAHCRDHRVIPNGIDTAGLPVATGSGRGRRLGFLGRLEEVKNPLLALDVLRALGDPDARLLVIGDGPLMPELRARTAAAGLGRQVELLGSLPRPEALGALAGVDVLLVPSLWEGMPLAPLEAMAMGVPVVASAVGGLPEIIETEESGILVDGRDPARYAEAVRRLIETPGLRARIVDRARSIVALRFAWSTTRQVYVDLYRELLGM